MATKKFDRTVWHGTDCDKVTSLFEYGLLVRYITKEKSWQCIYRNPHESNKFSYSWISEEDMREMFLTGWAKDDLKSFCSYVGDTWNDWLLRPVATRIYEYKHKYSRVMFDYGDNCPLTGMCYDYYLLKPIIDYYNAWCTYPEDFSLEDLMRQCYDNFFKSWHEEYEYWADDEDAIHEELHHDQYEDRLYYENGDVYVEPLNEIV